MFPIYLQFLNIQTLNMLSQGAQGSAVKNTKTVQTWYNYCRDVCTSWLLNNPFQIGQHHIFIFVFVERLIYHVFKQIGILCSWTAFSVIFIWRVSN